MLAATWVLAIATMVLALGAIGTVRYAKKAFKDQKQLNARQTEVLDLQQKDLHESLKQRQVAQAALIYVTNDYFSGRSHGSEEIATGLIASPPTVTAAVYNASPQPIYDVRIMWADARDLREAGDHDSLDTIRPGEQRMAKKELPPGSRSDVAIPVVYFRDAVGRRWTLLQDGYLNLIKPGKRPDVREAIMRTPRSALGV